MPGSRHRPCDVLVVNATIFTADAENCVIADGAVAIADGRLVAVGTSASVSGDFKAEKTIDARGGCLHPGFIDSHIHISQYTARSVLPAMDRATAAGRPTAMGHWKQHLTPEDERASALLASTEMVRAGFTGFVDPGTVLTTDAVADAVQHLGTRAWLTDPYVGDRAAFLAENFPDFFGGSFLDVWSADLDGALKRLGGELHRNTDPDATVRGFIGIYGEGTDSFELHAAALKLAEDNDVAFQKHLGYAPRTLAFLEREAGKPALAALAERNLLSDRVTLTHLNACTPADLQILSDTGVGLNWCPYGQLSMIGKDAARGRMASADRAGTSVALATDIPRAFNFGDLAKLGWVCGLASGDPVSAEQLFRMLTINGARNIGATKELGSIEPGKRADIVLRAPDQTTELGADRFLETVVLGGAAPVDHVFVNGRTIVEDGEFTSVDPERIRQSATRSVRRLLAQIGLR